MFGIWSCVMLQQEPHGENTNPNSTICLLSSILSGFPTQEVDFYIIVIISCSPDIRSVNGSLV